MSATLGLRQGKNFVRLREDATIWLYRNTGTRPSEVANLDLDAIARLPSQCGTTSRAAGGALMVPRRRTVVVRIRLEFELEPMRPAETGYGGGVRRLGSGGNATCRGSRR